jgi:hypothetical protein
MISEEKHYEYLGSVIINRLQLVRDAFKLFLQLFSAIVGGSVWLSLQTTITPATKHRLGTVSDALVWLVILVTGIMVLEALRSWWDYRVELSKLDGGKYPIPRPKARAMKAEAAMLICMIAAGVIFSLFNPFRIGAN